MSGVIVSALAHPGARHVTPLTPGRPNHGRAVGKIAQAFTVPLMPWQAHAAALATEQLPDGRWAYDELVITVQRRAGKTTLRLPLTWHRCLIRPGARCWLTAQKRQDARDILIDEVGPLVKKAPRFLTARAKPRRSQGSEGWHFTNGSSWRVFAPGEDDMHGKASEIVDVDEGWAFSSIVGGMIEQAVAPTKLTTDGQFSVFSTMGTAQSLWFHGKVAKAREANAAGSREGVAIVDFGLPDELIEPTKLQLEQGPDSPEWMLAMETLAHYHPAYGYTVTRVGAFHSVARQIFDAKEGGGPDQVIRALGNVPTDNLTSVIPWGKWLDRKATTWPRPTGKPILAVAVGVGRVDAAICAAWLHEGVVHVDVIDHRPGADWVPSRMLELAPECGRPPIIADRVGPNVDTVDELRRLALPVTNPSSSEYSTACQGFLDAITDGARLLHPGHAALNASVKVAGTRPLGDAGIAWSRNGSAGSIAALEAATLARWGLLSVPVMAAPGFTAG